MEANGTNCGCGRPTCQCGPPIYGNEPKDLSGTATMIALASSCQCCKDRACKGTPRTPEQIERIERSDKLASSRGRTATKKVSFQVTGMTCTSCVNGVESIVRNSLEGIATISYELVASFVLNRTVVEFDPKQTNVKAIAECIASLGYEVKEEQQYTTPGHVMLRIEGMTCASCVETIQNFVKTNPAVESIQINLLTEAANVKFIEGQVQVRDIVAMIEEIGYGASLYKDDAKRDALEKRREIEKYHNLMLFCLVFAIPEAFLMIGHFASPVHRWLGLSRELFRGITIVGWRFFYNSYAALSHKTATMDVLIALGIGTAYLYSILACIIKIVSQSFVLNVFFEVSLFIVTFVIIGRYLENIAKGKASEAITKLLLLQPPRARLMVRQGSQFELGREIDVEMLAPGDYVRVLAGERMPNDGIVVMGNSTADESMITVHIFSVFSRMLHPHRALLQSLES